MTTSDGIGGSRFSRNVSNATPVYPSRPMILVIHSNTARPVHSANHLEGRGTDGDPGGARDHPGDDIAGEVGAQIHSAESHHQAPRECPRNGHRPRRP